MTANLSDPLSFPKEAVNCPRLIRGLIVALLFRQAFEVLHGSKGLETPASHALHSELVNGSCYCGRVAPLAGSVQSLDGVFQFAPRLNDRPCANSTPILEKQKGSCRHVGDFTQPCQCVKAPSGQGFEA